MKEQDRQQNILSDLIVYLTKLNLDALEKATVRELVNGYFDQQDILAGKEKPFELIGESSEVH